MNTREFIKETIKRWRTKEAPVARDPKKTAVKKLGQAVSSGGAGGGFEPPTVDLDEISRAYHTDSYIKRAVDKYADLMFKNGWDFNGQNDKSVQYVNTRLQLIAEATGTPTDALLSQAAFDMVLFGNCFIVKARAKNGSMPAGVTAQGYSSKQPVAGYFVLPPSTVQVSRDANGNIVGYQQSAAGGQGIDIKPEDMIHIAYKRPTGRAYGIPFAYNVLDDVKILRQIEENVARLVYRNLFPLYVYQVGLDKPGFEATDDEITDIREQIRDMPMDGGIVLPERHNISVVGTQGSALDASPYLAYYRQRVFTGLGVSETVMGLGGTANKSTSDNQAADLFDGVKDFQRIFTEGVQLAIINELLFEGGFDPTMKPEDGVRFFFEEIELDAKIKKENHVTQLFTQNVITHDELRQQIGLEPVTDDSKLYFNMVTIAVANNSASNALSHAQTIGAQQAANQAGASQTPANNAGNNKDQPANQHGKQKSPGKPKASDDSENNLIQENTQKNSSKVLTENNEVVTLTTELQINSYTENLKSSWKKLRDDVVEMMQRGKSPQLIKGMTFELIKQSLRNNNRQYISSAMSKGIVDAQTELNKPIPMGAFNVQLETEKVIAQTNSLLERLVGDMSGLFDKAIRENSETDKVANVIGAFNSNEYRLSFIANTELYRAYNYGKAMAAQTAGLTTVEVTSGDKCDKCLEKKGQPFVLTAGTSLLDSVPPFHPNCTCVVTLNIPDEEV